MDQETLEAEMEITKKNELLNGLKEQIKALKFEETKAEAEKNKAILEKAKVETEKQKGPEKFANENGIDYLELKLRKKQTEASDREAHIKKLEKASYEVCTVVSRILKQVQKTKTPSTVDKNNVIDMLSYCGLQLERMLTVVIKKKKVMFLESINSNADPREGPPSYMNIVSDDVYSKSRKRAEKEKVQDILPESEDSYLSENRKKIKEKLENEAN